MTPTFADEKDSDMGICRPRSNARTDREAGLYAINTPRERTISLKVESDAEGGIGRAGRAHESGKNDGGARMGEIAPRHPRESIKPDSSPNLSSIRRAIAIVGRSRSGIEKRGVGRVPDLVAHKLDGDACQSAKCARGRIPALPCILAGVDRVSRMMQALTRDGNESPRHDARTVNSICYYFLIKPEKGMPIPAVYPWPRSMSPNSSPIRYKFPI